MTALQILTKRSIIKSQGNKDQILNKLKLSKRKSPLETATIGENIERNNEIANILKKSKNRKGFTT